MKIGRGRNGSRSEETSTLAHKQTQKKTSKNHVQTVPVKHELQI